MIKIKFRRNLLYLYALYLSYFIRKIIGIIIDRVFKLDLSYIYLFSMTLGEALGGLSVFIYHNLYFQRKKEVKYFGINLIYNKIELLADDGVVKKLVLIIFAGSFDIFEFIFAVFCIPKIADTSPTIKTRLGYLTTIISCFICAQAFGFRIGKHHKFSLICLSICFFMTLFFEFLFKPDDQPLDRFIFAHFLYIIILLITSCNDCIERYLAHYDYVNPFKVLMYEGIYETIFAICYSINKDPFRGLIDGYEKNNIGTFILLIVILIIYFVLCGVVNIYKVYCNVVYNPIARSLTEYFMNPLINIYYFIDKNDFHGDYLFFFISEIICLFMDFTFYLFNECLVLFCCGLEHDTRDEIHKRSEYPDLIHMLTFEEDDITSF